MATENDISSFLQFFIQRYDGKLTGERLDKLEATITSATSEFQQVKQTLGVIMAKLSDFTDILSKLTADVAAVKAKSDAADATSTENVALKAQIADLKKQLADAVANAGMSAAEEADLLKQISDLEAQLHPAPAPEPPAA